MDDISLTSDTSQLTSSLEYRIWDIYLGKDPKFPHSDQPEEKMRLFSRETQQSQLILLQTLWISRLKMEEMLSLHLTESIIPILFHGNI